MRGKKIDRREFCLEPKVASLRYFLDRAVDDDSALEAVGCGEVEGDFRDREGVIGKSQRRLCLVQFKPLSTPVDPEPLWCEPRFGVRKISRRDSFEDQVAGDFTAERG